MKGRCALNQKLNLNKNTQRIESRHHSLNKIQQDANFNLTSFLNGEF